MKKILIIGYYHSKNDKRVFRTVKALSEKSQVAYQYLSSEDSEIYFENNIKYIPIRFNINLSDNSLKKAIKRIKSDRKILKIIKNEDFDILYMHHFLPIFPLKPFKIAKKKGKEIVYDIHEYHPENFLNCLKGKIKIIKEKIMWNIFRKQLELSDKLIFVSKEMQKDIYEKLEINKPYLILPNFANISLKAKEKRKEISFVGKINRNLDDEKELIKELIKKGFRFKIIGMDSNYFDDIPHEYTAFLPYNKMMKELSKSSFSLISFNTIINRSYKNDIFSLPNKYYDSIAAETPVIVKYTFQSMAKEVEKYGIGVVINPNNLEESVEKILKAYRNYKQLLENIRKYKSKFVWNKEKEEKFINFILD